MRENTRGAARAGPRRLLLACTVAAVLLWTGCDSGRQAEALRRAAARGASIDHPLPSLSLKRLDGDTVALRSLLGDRLTLINFWGTWCKPCEEEMPHLVTLQEEWADRGVRVLGITVRSYDEEQIASWVARHEIQFPTLIGKSLAWMSREFPVSSGLPRTVLVDSRTETLRHLWVGARTREDLERGIRLYWRDRASTVDDLSR